MNHIHRLAPPLAIHDHYRVSHSEYAAPNLHVDLAKMIATTAMELDVTLHNGRVTCKKC
jgi:hypothetical protein